MNRIDLPYLHTKFFSIAIRGLLLTACGLALAQSYSIDWFTIAGGGTSTNSQYSISGAIGQPHANQQAMTGGNYSLTGGFWSVLQTPGAPVLTITLTATNSAVVFWPSPSAGWNLQQLTDLNTTNWVVPSEPVLDNGTTKLIILNAPTGNRFYRLFKP